MNKWGGLCIDVLTFTIWHSNQFIELRRVVVVVAVVIAVMLEKRCEWDCEGRNRRRFMIFFLNVTSCTECLVCLGAGNELPLAQWRTPINAL